MKRIFAVIIMVLTYSVFQASPVRASDGVCGFYAFAGAFSTRRAAQRQANRVGGQVFDLDASDSPNAGKGLWVVGAGPGSKYWANQRKRDFRRNGARSAYVASRCMY